MSNFLPESWAEVQLGALADFEMGQAPAGSDCNRDGHGTPFVKAGEFGAERPVIREWTTNPLKFARETDVLICVVGATAGKLNLGIDCAIGRSAAAIRPSHDLDQRYLHKYLTTLVQEMRSGSTGSAQGVISKEALAKIEIPLAPLPEQRRIVAKLDRLSARSRAARGDLARTAKLAVRAKQAILAAALADLADFGPLGDLARDIRYGTARKCDYEGGPTPVLRIPNVAAGRIDSADLKRASFEPREVRTLALEVGDLLIIRSNGSVDLVGRSAVVGEEHAGYLYAGYLIRVRLDLDRALPEFVQLVLSSSTTRRLVERLAKSTSGVNNINSKQLAGLPIPRATVPKQRELVRHVGAAFARIDRLTAEAARAARLLARLDERLLAKAFRGELVPQDPTDEPAEALLARIRTERTTYPGLAAAGARGRWRHEHVRNRRPQTGGRTGGPTQCPSTVPVSVVSGPSAFWGSSFTISNYTPCHARLPHLKRSARSGPRGFFGDTSVY